MSHKAKKRKPAPYYTVLFTSSLTAGKFYNEDYPIVSEAIEARGHSPREVIVEASRELARQLKLKPTWAKNITWSKDQFTFGAGYVTAQGLTSQGRLGRPYYVSKRLAISIVPGRLPRQLCFNF